LTTNNTNIHVSWEEDADKRCENYSVEIAAYRGMCNISLIRKEEATHKAEYPYL